MRHLQAAVRDGAAWIRLRYGGGVTSPTVFFVENSYLPHSHSTLALDALPPAGSASTTPPHLCDPQVARLARELEAEKRRNKEEAERDRVRLEALASSRPKADGGSKKAVTGNKKKVKEAKEALAKAVAEGQARRSPPPCGCRATVPLSASTSTALAPPTASLSPLQWFCPAQAEVRAMQREIDAAKAEAQQLNDRLPTGQTAAAELARQHAAEIEALKAELQRAVEYRDKAVADMPTHVTRLAQGAAMGAVQAAKAAAAAMEAEQRLEAFRAQRAASGLLERLSELAMHAPPISAALLEAAESLIEAGDAAVDKLCQDPAAMARANAVSLSSPFSAGQRAGRKVLWGETSCAYTRGAAERGN